MNRCNSWIFERISRLRFVPSLEFGCGTGSESAVRADVSPAAADEISWKRHSNSE